jgi:hypothetical protein
MSESRRSRLVADVDFEADGRQSGFLRLFHSVHASAYGFIPIPIVVIRNGPGPTALFVSGNHGDEYEGQVALSNLAKALDPGQIKGRVILLPMANFPAAMAGRRTSPIDEGNLNRSFPGDPDGGVTRQIAFYIEHVLIPMADIVCDLHSGGSSLMYVPCALIKNLADPVEAARLQAALRAFGAPLAYVTGGGHGTGEDHTLSGGGAGDRRARAAQFAGACRYPAGGEPGGAGAADPGADGGRPGVFRLCAGERRVRAAGGTRGDGGGRSTGGADAFPGNPVGAAGGGGVRARGLRAVHAGSRAQHARGLPVPSGLGLIGTAAGDFPALRAAAGGRLGE